MGRPLNSVDALQSRINKTDSCWVWHGAIADNGYSKVRFRNKHTSVHRVIYEHYKGKIPKGFQVDHLCKNKLCVNPEHLEAVTPAENTRRASKKANLLIVRIIKKLTGKIKQHEISGIFGLHQCHVSRIVSGKRWEGV